MVQFTGWLSFPIFLLNCMLVAVSHLVSQVERPCHKTIHLDGSILTSDTSILGRLMAHWAFHGLEITLWGKANL